MIVLNIWYSAQRSLFALLSNSLFDFLDFTISRKITQLPIAFQTFPSFNTCCNDFKIPFRKRKTFPLLFLDLWQCCQCPPNLRNIIPKRWIHLSFVITFQYFLHQTGTACHHYLRQTYCKSLISNSLLISVQIIIYSSPYLSCLRNGLPFGFLPTDWCKRGPFSSSNPSLLVQQLKY